MVRGLRAGAVRIGAVLLASVVTGALAASPALADLGLEPTAAPRGAGIQIVLRVPEERPGAYTSQVRLDLPADLPIAEVYPMSVDDWAPRTTNYTLDEPLRGLHGGLMTEVTESIVWLRVTDAPARPEPVELVVSIGPLPDADQVEFTVTQTYSDGTQVRWGGPGGRPGPVLTLLAADPAAVAGHGAHGGVAPPAGGQVSAPVPVAAADGAGTDLGLLLAGLAGGALVGAAVVWWRSRARRTPRASSQEQATADPAASAGTPDEAALVTAGAGGDEGRWRLTED
ncbi:DUF1775 domain-containing protein [Solwaraspora sp. WMMB335]|uniref:DUF1775 domain-containing protein n=1 Tax=Solwaraspora sp. WMMB335 TaxID=3404118 RepID=UPI003B93D1E8